MHITVDGVTVSVPLSVEAEGGEAIDAYVAAELAKIAAAAQPTTTE